MCYFSPLLGEDFQFEERIFLHGWLNYQLQRTVLKIINEFETQIFITNPFPNPRHPVIPLQGRHFRYMLGVQITPPCLCPSQEAFPTTLLRFGSVLPGSFGGRKGLFQIVVVIHKIRVDSAHCIQWLTFRFCGYQYVLQQLFCEQKKWKYLRLFHCPLAE